MPMRFDSVGDLLRMRSFETASVSVSFYVAPVDQTSCPASTASYKTNCLQIDAVLRRIKSLRIKDPTAKILLFTSLQMLIAPLCAMMNENDIKFRSLLNSDRQKALADFRLKAEVEVGFFYRC